jgi:hypothetical protein
MSLRAQNEAAPSCVRCKGLMRFHSLQTVDSAQSEMPHTMQVFTCERCGKWEAVPDGRLPLVGYRMHKLFQLTSSQKRRKTRAPDFETGN